MRPTFLGFQAARSGLVSSQKALDIVGNNIANMNTEGYTRQRVDLISMTFSGPSSRYAVGNTTLAGQGVYISGTSQIRDPFLDMRYREQSSYLGTQETVVSAYTDLENLFDDVTSSGLQDSMVKFMAQIEDLSGATDKTENAGTVLTAAKNLVQLMNSYSSKLDQIDSQNSTCLDVCVENVNSILEKLSSLNGQIKDACLSNTMEDPITGGRRMLGPYGPNELYDDRNLLLDQLSAFGEVDVKTEADSTITLTFGGTVVLEGTKADSLSLTKDETGANDLQWLRAGSEFDSRDGAITAYANLLDGKGGYASTGENDFEGIGYYREVINSFSSTLATSFNEANKIPIVDEFGAPVLDLITGDPTYSGGDLFKTSDGSADYTADNIRISDDWIADPQFILMSATDDQGKLDNSNILKMISMFDDNTLSFGSSSGSYTEFKGSFEGYLVHFQTKLGDQKDYYESTCESTTSVALELLDARDSVSAVSENEEAINMMTYQKSYNAAARLITAVDEMLDVLINKMGRVGL
ncbi:MAG: flagellar hook-associated protein FlgK [Acetanaerobacterium sp.]